MLRWAQEKDAEKITFYSRQLFEQKSQQFQLNLNTYKNMIGMYVEIGWARYLVYEYEGEMAGWILFGKNVDPMEGSERGFLYELFVLPELRRRGIGRILMNTAVDELLKNGFTEIQLNVYAGNPGKKLYEEIGFVDRQTLMEFKKRN